MTIKPMTKPMTKSMTLNLNRRHKRAIFIALDISLVPVCLYLAFCLRFGTPWALGYMQPSLVLVPVLGLAALGLVLFFGIDRIKLAALDVTAMGRMGGVALLLTLTAMASSYVLQLPAPRSVPLIFGVIYFGGTVAARALALLLLSRVLNHIRPATRVAIYGAGAAGMQLALALRNAREVHPVVFVDDNPALHGLIISGLEVMPPKVLDKMAARGKIARVLVAIPSLPKPGQRDIVNRLSHLPCDIQVLPSYVDLIASGQPPTPVAPDELLGRDKVDLDIADVNQAYAGRVVMVTGAGGSIGSELCRQLLHCAPKAIVLYDQGEFNLYDIERELRPLADDAGVALVARLGSVTHAARVADVIADMGVQIILHAAAYKHVPLVEDNPLEGAGNNVLGTQIVAMAAQQAGVERFILVSTDKAVRPTNIMGASKRMAELVIQDLQTRSDTTRFAMVRFGNVLGSSGSVLPLFQRQIAAGGPVTVTHPDVTRFFMTIPEAARLVLLAGAYATGGDVFVLDMGRPVKIYDIARRMIELSGQKVKTSDTGGGIAIQVTGLRPGEKLYEELLIDDASLVATPHPKILRAQESKLSEIEVAGMIKDIPQAIETGDAPRLTRVVETHVAGYHQPKAQNKKAE